MLADCGRGVLMRLVAAGVLPMMLDAVLVTHLHSDHLTDLNDVIVTNWIMSPAPRPLRVFGPPHREVVDATLAALAPDVSYRIAHHDDLTEGPVVDVTEVSPGDAFDLGPVRVRVAGDRSPTRRTDGRVQDRCRRTFGRARRRRRAVRGPRRPVRRRRRRTCRP